MNFDLSPLLLTFKLASTTTLILIVLGVPLAYWTAFTRSRWKYVVGPLVSMPLVLPPTVLGFYILLLFSGTFVVFSFLGLVIGSVIFSLPFMVNPIKAGFQNFPRPLMEASFALGKSEWQTLINVVLPNIKPAITTGIVMAFAHTVGEFGVVLMVGGSIPGETRTASIAIFSEVEALNYANAHFYAGVLFVLAFSILFVLNLLQAKDTRTVV